MNYTGGLDFAEKHLGLGKAQIKIWLFTRLSVSLQTKQKTLRN